MPYVPLGQNHPRLRTLLWTDGTVPGDTTGPGLVRKEACGGPLPPPTPLLSLHLQALGSSCHLPLLGCHPVQGYRRFRSWHWVPHSMDTLTAGREGAQREFGEESTHTKAEESTYTNQQGTWLSREPGDSKPGEERAGEQGDVEASRSGQDRSAGCRRYAASGGPGEPALG